MMKILVAAFAYNERPYISYMVDYYRSQGCDLVILDNYSTDGTYEWLVENGVRTGRVDTRDSFHLIKLQHALLKEFEEIKPDWIVYTGIDTYYYFSNTIREEIEKANKLGFTTIGVGHIEAYRTDEEFKMPFQNTYFYVLLAKERLSMIAKYLKPFRFNGDNLISSSIRVYHSDGFLINYGFCKTKEERKLTYTRRKKAWELGNPRGHGSHYKVAADRNWTWAKEEFIDIRTTPYYKMMMK